MSKIEWPSQRCPKCGDTCCTSHAVTADEPGPINLPLWNGECDCGNRGEHLMAECRKCGELWGVPPVQKAPPMPEGWTRHDTPKGSIWRNRDGYMQLWYIAATGRWDVSGICLTQEEADFLGWTLQNLERVRAETGNVPEVTHG